MDIDGLEKFLVKENMDVKPTPGGLLVNLGFLVGRVYIKYDSENKFFHYNDKARWISQAFILLIMLYFLISNLGIYSDIQKIVCVTVTIGMVGIFAFKERKINFLKDKIKNRKK